MTGASNITVKCSGLRIAKATYAKPDCFSLSNAFDWRFTRLPHGAREFAKSLRGDGGEERVFVAKMAVGRVVGNPGSPRDFAKSERRRPQFGNDANRSFQECFAQVAVMVGSLGHRSRSILHGHVDKRNIDPL